MAYVKFFAENTIQAGDFMLAPGMSYESLLDTLSMAKVEEVRITVPEGFVLDEIGELVVSEFALIDENEWREAVSPNSPLKREFSVLENIPDDMDLEGYLFPDTYRFKTDAKALDIAKRMVETLVIRLSDNNIDYERGEFTAGLSFHEVITLASIIQKEVRSESEMREVADIFLKRLEDGMMLQADSTVNYVTGGDSPSITLEETELDSPYNTYENVGLPPGPISNPGIKAIEAVLNPSENQWYYFLTTPEGEVIYARTHAQHVQNKQRYLK